MKKLTKERAAINLASELLSKMDGDEITISEYDLEVFESICLLSYVGNKTYVGIIKQVIQKLDDAEARWQREIEEDQVSYVYWDDEKVRRAALKLARAQKEKVNRYLKPEDRYEIKPELT